MLGAATYTVFFMVHNNLLQGDKSACLAGSSAMDLTIVQVFALASHLEL